MNKKISPSPRNFQTILHEKMFEDTRGEVRCPRRCIEQRPEGRCCCNAVRVLDLKVKFVSWPMKHRSDDSSVSRTRRTDDVKRREERNGHAMKPCGSCATGECVVAARKNGRGD